MNVTDVWDGEWVREHLGVGLSGAPNLADFIGLALRHNPRRAHLLVSRVLGKHVPADPEVVVDAGLALASRVGVHLGGRPPLVLGFAETATGLGHLVADGLAADYLHSTRRAVPGVTPAGGFEEEHSHATGHLLLPDVPDLLAGGQPLVLIDDELSTGRTAANTIRALHARFPRETYVVAALVDARDRETGDELAAVADDLGTQIIVTATCSVRAELPADAVACAERLMAAHAQPPVARRGSQAARAVPPVWPRGVRDGGRHGFRAPERAAAASAAEAVAEALSRQLAGERVLVLGSEELMYAPLLIAREVARLASDRAVRVSSTTRSPVFVLDEPGYAVRTGLTFSALEGSGARYAYNVAPARGTEPYDDIVLVTDDVCDTSALRAPGGLLDLLSGAGGRVHLVVLPSYRPGQA